MSGMTAIVGYVHTLRISNSIKVSRTLDHLVNTIRGMTTGRRTMYNPWIIS